MNPNARALLVIVEGWDQAEWVARFRNLAPGRDIRAWPETGDPAGIGYIAAWRPKPGTMAGLPNLQAVFNLGAGVDHVMSDPDLPDVPLVRVVDDSLTRPMTEYVVLQVLTYFRRMPEYAALQRENRWMPLRQPMARDVTIGIMGLGVLGCDAAARLLPFGFNVIGWSRSTKQLSGITTYAGASDLDAFLGATDILVSLLPATPETRGLIDRKLLAKLRKDGALGGPVLVNAGRGASQVEADIAAALDAGDIVGASLDVFEAEPLDASSPLWSHPRVIVTPHIAADSDPDLIGRYVIDAIAAFEAGDGLVNIVDKSRGY